MAPVNSDLLTGLLVMVSAAVVYFHLKKFSFWSSRNVKGPMPWPVFGTNIYFVFNNKIKLDQKWRKQYGKVYGLYEGYSPLLVVSDAKILEHIYVKQFRSFTDRHNEFIQNELFRNWLLWVPGKEWSAKRALVSPLFSSSKMKVISSKMSACINRFLDEVERRSEDQSGGGGAKGVRMTKSDISAMTIDVMADNFYSLRVNTYQDKSNELLKRAYDLAQIQISRFIVWSLIPRYLAKLTNFDLFDYPKIQYFDMLVKKIIAERRKSPSATKNLDLIQMFLDAKVPDVNEQMSSIASNDCEEREVSLYSGQSAQDQQKSIRAMNEIPLKSMSDMEIRGQMNFMFVAGFETTAQTLNFCLFELGHQPEMQERLREELERVFESNLDVLRDRKKVMPSENYQQLMELTLLGAFISETLRLYAPIISNNRKPNEPVVLPTEPEIQLPIGVPIETNTFVLHRDPEYWNEPDKFDLTRFLPENRQSIKPGTYWPFGMGARHCLGMRFALLEIRLALAKIVLNYQIKPVNMKYPPEFQHNPVFLLLEDNNFELCPRKS